MFFDRELNKNVHAVKLFKYTRPVNTFDSARSGFVNVNLRLNDVKDFPRFEYQNTYLTTPPYAA